MWIKRKIMSIGKLKFWIFFTSLIINIKSCSLLLTIGILGDGGIPQMGFNWHSNLRTKGSRLNTTLLRKSTVYPGMESMKFCIVGRRMGKSTNGILKLILKSLLILTVLINL